MPAKAQVMQPLDLSCKYDPTTGKFTARLRGPWTGRWLERAVRALQREYHVEARQRASRERATGMAKAGGT